MIYSGYQPRIYHIESSLLLAYITFIMIKNLPYEFTNPSFETVKNFRTIKKWILVLCLHVDMEKSTNRGWLTEVSKLQYKLYDRSIIIFS